MGAIFGALLMALPAQAENTVPSAQRQEILIKTTLLTFNDANLTSNYEVLHAKLAKPFRDKFSPDKLRQTFKAFVDQKIDLGPVVLKPPVATTESKIDGRGMLQLRFYFDTAPSRVLYEIDYAPSEGGWNTADAGMDRSGATRE